MELSFENLNSENKPRKLLTKDDILNHCSQEELFEKYANQPISNEMFCSSLRDDRNPGCRFHYSKNGVLYHVDYALGEYLDVFGYIGKKYTASFVEVINLIGADYALISNKPIDRIPLVIEASERVKEASKERVPITITEREWGTVDSLYWSNYFIGKDVFEYFDAQCVENAWIGDSLYYMNDKENPCYAYRNLDGMKLYQPKTNNKGNKWRNNSSLALGWRQEMHSDSKTLVITKSLKDIMVLYKFGVTSVSPQGEGMVFKESWMNLLREKFENIYILMDNDMAGMRSMIKYRQAYPFIECLMYPKELGKDTSDVVEKMSVEQASVYYKLINSKYYTFKEIVNELKTEL